MPELVLVNVITLLEEEDDLLNFTCVSKWGYSFMQKDVVWNTLSIRHFGNRIEDKNPQESWKSFYYNCYRTTFVCPFFYKICIFDLIYIY